MPLTRNLCLDVLCSLLAASAEGKTSVGEEVDRGAVMHHVAFALGERLLEPITGGEHYGFVLTERGKKVHALLCDSAQKPQMAEMLKKRNAFEVADWLEARVPLLKRA